MRKLPRRRRVTPAIWQVMPSVADKAIAAFRPRILYPYYELTWETRIEPTFRKRVADGFKQWLANHGRDLNWLLNTPGFVDPPALDAILD